jgi:hypothetical protein
MDPNDNYRIRLPKRYATTAADEALAGTVMMAISATWRVPKTGRISITVVISLCWIDSAIID